MKISSDFTYADAYKNFFKVKENPDRLVAKIYEADGEEDIKFKESLLFRQSDTR